MIILNRDPMVAARELCDRDLRACVKRAADLTFRSLNNAKDGNDSVLQWVNKSKANLKWIADYALYCTAESYYRFGPLAKVPHRATKIPEIKGRRATFLPFDPKHNRSYYINVIAPQSVWPKCLWTKRYPPDWMAPFIYPNAQLSL